MSGNENRKRGLRVRVRVLGAVFIAAMSSLCGTGCASNPEYVTLSYTSSGATPIPGASDVSVNVQVRDQRPDTTKVSSKLGYAPIISNQDVAAMVQQAVLQELAARGFQFSNDTLNMCLVNVDLNRLYNNWRTGVWSGSAVADFDVKVTVKAKAGDSPHYSKYLMTQAENPNCQLASGSNAEIALNQVLSDGIKKILNDKDFIIALLKSCGDSTVAMESQTPQPPAPLQNDGEHNAEFSQP